MVTADGQSSEPVVSVTVRSPEHDIVSDHAYEGDMSGVVRGPFGLFERTRAAAFGVRTCIPRS